MLKNLQLLFIFILCGTVVIAGEPVQSTSKFEKCGFNRRMDLLKSGNPDFEMQLRRDEVLLQSSLNNNSLIRSSEVIHTIPVVVHVLYFDSTQNVSDAQIQSQIDVLNEDFGRTNVDKINTPPPFVPAASGTDFRFCLATKDPNGVQTNGIERRQVMNQQFQHGSDMKHYSTGGLDAWDVDRYLNIWVCNLGSQILGYGDLPSSVHSNEYGVVVTYTAFGRNGSAVAPYHLGRTVTHEISHCFNLYHIFSETGNCAGSDQVNDTPSQFEATFGCHSFSYADTCTPSYPGIMFMNYMDYSDDDCMNMFTAGQASRMLAAMNLYYPTLLSSNGCLTDDLVEINDFNFSIYPNPSSGTVNIDLFTELKPLENSRIKITDALGKIVFESGADISTNHIMKINLGHLDNGLYFVTLSNENYKRTEPVILKK